MKLPRYLLLLALLPCLVFGQARSAKMNAESEKAVRKLEDDFVTALVKADADAVGRMLTEDFQFVGPDGTVQNKAGFVRDVKSGDLKLTSSAMSEISVHFASADLVILTYRSLDKGTFKNNDITGSYRWTDVAVKRDGRWQFLVGHGTPIPPPKP